jgi:hypothetical protein
MNRIAKIALAFLAVASLPLAAVAPAAAVSSFASVEIGCTENLSDPYYGNFPLFEPTVTVSLVNCEGYGIKDAGDTTNASLGSSQLDSIVALDIVSSPVTLTITGPVELTLVQGGDPMATIQFVDPQTIPDPADSSLLSTSTGDIPLTVDEFVYGTQQQYDAEEDSNVYGDCWLRAGHHVYSTSTLTVDESGNYTMRVVGQDPSGDYLHQDDGYDTWDDSVILVYNAFDPSNIDSNIVGCGDEINPGDFGLEDGMWFKTEDDQRLSASWPYFDMDLDPGTYTLVYTTYYPLSADQWANGTDDYGDWDPTTQSITTELWGPDGGASLVSETEAAAADLASTGVNATFGLWAGLGLLGTGAAVAVARRRSVRA